MTPSPERVSLPRSERKLFPGATETGKTSPEQILSVSIITRRKTQLSLEELGGRVLSREEFDEKYAADPEDFAALRQFASRHDLTVVEAASSLSRRTIVLRGTAQNLEKAFGVELRNYKCRDGLGAERDFHGYTGTVSLPQEHAGLVSAVLGLDARPLARPHIRFLSDAQQAEATSYNPPQIAALYNFPTQGNGAGETIGIIELGGGYETSDISTYFSGLGLTPPTVVAVSVDGATNSPGDPNGADGEVALDIQVAGSIAPGAKIAVYFTTNTDQGFIDAITTAVHDTTNNPSVISISWGGPESSWSQSSLSALNEACQSAGALGVTITVASGDSGSSDGGEGNNVDFPASSPYVLGCGGTELESNGTTITSEVVWNDGEEGGATGGGVSVDFPLPTWQQNAGVPASSSSSGGRGVPDVAGNASPETGYNILVDGEQEVVGGTSAVAPLWAALIALVNQQRGTPVGFVNPTLYANPSAFHDITSGNNGSFSAGLGWDACTGLGSPIGTAIAAALTTATTTTGTGSGNGNGNGSGGSGGTGSGGTTGGGTPAKPPKHKHHR